MIMRRTPTPIEPPQPLKSYRQRRAQSRSNHNHLSTTDTKGLQQIQQSLNKRRLSIQENDSIFGSFLEEEILHQEPTVRLKTEPVVELEQNQKLEETQSTRIISKYADALEFIKEVEEEERIQQKINPEMEGKPGKVVVPLIKNFPGQNQQGKKVVGSIAGRGSFNLSKVQGKGVTDLNNFITPRKVGGGVKQIGGTGVGMAGKSGIGGSIKSERKVPDTKSERKGVEGKGKMEQSKFVKKLQGLEEELMRLGFQKQAEAKWHLRNILELLKDG